MGVEENSQFGERILDRFGLGRRCRNRDRNRHRVRLGFGFGEHLLQRDRRGVLAATIVEPPALWRGHPLRMAITHFAGARAALARFVEPHGLAPRIEGEGRSRDCAATGSRTLSPHGNDRTA